MFRMRMMSEICAVAILCGGQGVSAQTIYKLTDAIGHTIFTDRSPAGVLVVPNVTSSSQDRDRVPLPRNVTGTRLDVANALSSNSAMTSTYAATIDFNEATRRLQQARQNRQKGMARLPGEGTPDAGTTSMSKRYQRRQQKLQSEVVAAELRSRETWLVRNALSSSDGKIEPLKVAKR